MRKKDIDEARKQFIGNCKGLIEHINWEYEGEKRGMLLKTSETEKQNLTFPRLILEFMYENENIYKILEKEITKDFGKRFDRKAENDEFFVFERMTKLLKGETIERAK
tara:strand:- start:229 stop:552 length:324 start_codon:yes stop_codon:yes gene_type:complete